MGAIASILVSDNWCSPPIAPESFGREEHCAIASYCIVSAQGGGLP